MTDQNLPAGVIDSLSQFMVGVQSNARYDGTVSELGRNTMEDWLRDILIQKRPNQVTVNHRNAIGLPAVWYAVSKIAGHIGTMNLDLYRSIGDRKKTKATSHPAYRLRKYPSELILGCVFREVLTGHAIFRGNGRAYIERDPVTFRPLRLTPMLPHLTKTGIVGGEKWHVTEIVVNEETDERRSYRIPDRDVIHIMGYGNDGIRGYDLLELAEETFRLSIAPQLQQAGFYEKDAKPGLILEAPDGAKGVKTDEDAMAFLKAFRQAHEGIDNAGVTGLLRHGIKATELKGSSRENETNALRLFQRQDVALLFALESILGDDASVSYGSSEQKHIAYLINQGKWIEKWESELDAKLLTERQKQSESHWHKLNPGSLLRADMKTTMETLRTGIESTIYSPNDARDILGEDAREGGDVYENPNTKANTGEPSQTADEENEAAEAAQARLRAVIANRLKALIGTELKSIGEALESKPAIDQWLGKFYDGWCKSLHRQLLELGDDDGLANRIVEQHKSEASKLTDANQIPFLKMKWDLEADQLAADLAKG